MARSRTFGVRFNADTSAFAQGVADMERRLGRFNQVMGSAGARLGIAMGAGAAAATAAVGKFAAASIREFASVEAALKRNEALLGDVSNLTDYTTAVRKLAKETGLAAEQLSATGYNVISAGATAIGDFTASLELAAKASAATGASADSVALAFQSTTNAFGRDVKEVADILTSTARLGTTNLELLAANFGKVGGIAGALSIDLESVSAALATITSKGINTEEAVTGLAAFLSEATKPASELSAAITEVTGGLTLLEAAKSGITLADIIGDLSSTFSESELNTIIKNIRAKKAILPLAASQEVFGNFYDQILNSQGEVARQFLKASEAYQFQLDRAKAVVGDLQFTFGEILGDDFSGVVNRFTDGIEALTDDQLFVAAMDQFSNSASELAHSLLDAVPDMALAAKTYADGFDVWGGAFGSFATGVGQGSSPVLLSSFAEFNREIDGVLKELVPVATELANTLLKDFGQSIADVSGALGAVGANLAALAPLVSASSEALSQLTQTVSAGLGTLNVGGSGYLNPALLFGGALLGKSLARGASGALKPRGSIGRLFDPSGNINRTLRTRENLTSQFAYPGPVNPRHFKGLSRLGAQEASLPGGVVGGARVGAVGRLGGLSRGLGVAGQVLGGVGIAAAVGSLGVGIGTRIWENATRTNKGELKKNLQPIFQDLPKSIEELWIENLDTADVSSQFAKQVVNSQYGIGLQEAMAGIADLSADNFKTALEQNNVLGEGIEKWIDNPDTEQSARNVASAIAATFEDQFGEEIKESEILKLLLTAGAADTRAKLESLERQYDLTGEDTLGSQAKRKGKDVLAGYLGDDASKYAPATLAYLGSLAGRTDNANLRGELSSRKSTYFALEAGGVTPEGLPYYSTPEQNLQAQTYPLLNRTLRSVERVIEAIETGGADATIDPQDTWLFTPEGIRALDALENLTGESGLSLADAMERIAKNTDAIADNTDPENPVNQSAQQTQAFYNVNVRTRTFDRQFASETLGIGAR